MKALLQQISVEVSPKLYLKDPTSSDLGKSILREGIELINEIGLEAFNFKKLAKRLQTTESSIYRYFENKHKFLLYLINWYWGWLEYEIVLSTTNLSDPRERLLRTTTILCQPVSGDLNHQLLDLPLLHNIVIEEAPKIFFTKGVESDNENGLFSGYKRVVSRLAETISEANPNYQFQLTLSTTILEAINQQKFLKAHFPRMSNLNGSNNGLEDFIKNLILSVLMQ
jgi:AcrR family transcriptional regulator